MDRGTIRVIVRIFSVLNPRCSEPLNLVDHAGHINDHVSYIFNVHLTEE